MHAIDVPTQQTVEFVQACVAQGSHILEVGCGDGEVAFALSRRGFQVTAIDSDPERIAKAQKPGIRAMVAAWPEFEIAPVDAIVFTRSLHHMDRLIEAIDRAQSVLKPNGTLLVDDFAVESATEPTLNWFRNLVQVAPFAAVAQPHPDSFVTKLLLSESPMKTFEDHHTAHQVHPFDLMHRLITERFARCTVQPVPYFYRYFASVAGETGKGADLVKKFLHREIEAAEGDEIVLIGRRIVGRMI
ncbi:MAG TPA: class I SAM-dependent methyltransferase [Chthoniobacterales bacterium]|nr:class I SAM-dependent methyltransferase [Chthoniobacterales bacterium]